jgi:hypothetical protein
VLLNEWSAHVSEHIEEEDVFAELHSLTKMNRLSDFRFLDFFIWACEDELTFPLNGLEKFPLNAVNSGRVQNQDVPPQIGGRLRVLVSAHFEFKQLF